MPAPSGSLSLEANADTGRHCSLSSRRRQAVYAARKVLIAASTRALISDAVGDG